MIEDPSQEAIPADVGGLEILEAVRDELEDMALRLADARTGTSGLAGAVVQMLGDAAAALTRAIDAAGEERAFFDALTRIDELLESLERPLAERFDEGEAAALRDARRWIRTGRARRVEEVARTPPSPSAPPSRAAGELRVSRGRPIELPWREVAPYREMRRRPDPFAEDDEEESDEDEGSRSAFPDPGSSELVDESMTCVVDDDFRALAPVSAGLEPADVFLRAASRDLLEDVGIFGSLRMLGPSEPWAVAGRFEARLLAALDGLAALASPRVPSRKRLLLVERAWAHANEWQVPDRGRSFSLALTLASIAEPVASRWLLRWLQGAAGPALEGAVEGLCLGVSPRRTQLLDDAVSRESRPDALALLLDGARRLRHGSMAVVMLSAHPDPLVAEAAVRCLAHADRDAAAAALSAALASPSIGVSMAAAEVLLGFGAAGGRATLRDRVAARDVAPEARTRAMRALCLCGDRRDADLVLETSVAHGALRPLLGWFGAPSHVPALAEALRAEVRTAGPRSEVALALSTAIHRITGVGRRADVRAVAPHAHEVDLDRWAPAALEVARRADAPRLRFGRPWSATEVLAELESPRTPQGARRLLAVELSLALGRALPLDVDDWAANQREGLELVRADLRVREAPR